MKKSAAVLLVSAFTVASACAAPITYDLRDTSGTTEIESGVIVRDGLTATLTPIVEGGSGALNQTSSGFGVDATGSGDNTHEIDDALGTESISIQFTQDTFLKQITLSDFTTSETALLAVGGFPTRTLDGTRPATDVYDFDADNFIAAGQTVVLKFGEGNGFSFDSFTIEPPKGAGPVPDSIGLLTPAATLTLVLLISIARKAPPRWRTVLHA